MSPTAASQIDAARRQLDAARRGAVLLSLHAEIHPPIMLETPTNDVGAQIRVAYWLATAARMSGGHGGLTVAAARALQAADDAPRWTILGPLLGGGSSTTSVDRILYDAEALARRAGRDDVARVLNGIRPRGEITPTGGIPGLRTPAARSRALAAWTVGGASIVTIVAVGAGLWFTAPLWLPLVQGAAMRRASQRRR